MHEGLCAHENMLLVIDTNHFESVVSATFKTISIGPVTGAEELNNELNKRIE